MFQLRCSSPLTKQHLEGENLCRKFDVPAVTSSQEPGSAELRELLECLLSKKTEVSQGNPAIRNASLTRKPFWFPTIFLNLKVMNVGKGEKSIDTEMIHNPPNEEINHSALNLDILSILCLFAKSKRNSFNIKSNTKLFQTLHIVFCLKADTRWNEYRCKPRHWLIFNTYQYSNHTVMWHRTSSSPTEIRLMPRYCWKTIRHDHVTIFHQWETADSRCHAQSEASQGKKKQFCPTKLVTILSYPTVVRHIPIFENKHMP